MDAGVDVFVGPEAVLEGFDLFDFLCDEGLCGEFGTGFGDGLSEGVEVGVGETLVGEVLELVLLLCRAVLADDVLVCCDLLSVLAFEDVRFAGLETYGGLVYVQQCPVVIKSYP